MAAVVATDWSVAVNGDIRYTGTGTKNTVIELHRWLGDLMDNAQASGNDILDITDATATERSTDNYITFNSPYNIDDEAAKYLFDGSIVQGGGGVIYDGIVCYAPAGTYLYIVQNGKVLTPNFWTTSYNPDAGAGISHRFMVKTRSTTDIDGRRLIGLARVWGNTFAEFKVAPTARGNNTVALSPVTDLNNATTVGTVKGWVTITNTEGFRVIDVNNDGMNEGYYSEWNRATYTINQFYERAKLLSKGATVEASCADTGSAFQVANAAIIGQSQSFQNGVQTQYLTRVFANLRKVGLPTGNLTAVLYTHSGTYGTSSIPTAAALATSVNIDVSKLRTTYQTVEIGFDTQYKMVASTYYCIAFEHAAIDGSNYVEVEGFATTGTHGGNRAQLEIATWTPTAGDDLNFQVDVSPELYEISGQLFRGITHEIIADTLTGTFQPVEPISWGTGATAGTGQLLAQKFCDTGAGALTINVVAAAGTFTRTTGSYITDGFLPGMTIVTSGMTGGNNATKIISTITVSGTVITVTSNSGLADESGTNDERIKSGHIWMQLLTGVAPIDDLTITGGQSSATALMNVTITGRDLSFPFVGASTGSAIIGAYGVGIEYADLAAADKVFDLTNTQRVPPNNVTFTVYGLTTDDRVLVGPEDGAGGLKIDQLTLNTTLTSGSTTVVVTTAIPADTPAAGTIRVLDDNGVYIHAPYTSWVTSTFTLTGTFGSDAGQPKNVFVSYIDKDAGAANEAFTTIYDADRTLFIRVRDGKSTPIKTAETTSTLGTAGGSVTVNRISDL